MQEGSLQYNKFIYDNPIHKEDKAIVYKLNP
jgi:hypothetical protein